MCISSRHETKSRGYIIQVNLILFSLNLTWAFPLFTTSTSNHIIVKVWMQTTGRKPVNRRILISSPSPHKHDDVQLNFNDYKQSLSFSNVTVWGWHLCTQPGQITYFKWVKIYSLNVYCFPTQHDLSHCKLCHVRRYDKTQPTEHHEGIIGLKMIRKNISKWQHKLTKM